MGLLLCIVLTSHRLFLAINMYVIGILGIKDNKNIFSQKLKPGGYLLLLSVDLFWGMHRQSFSLTFFPPSSSQAQEELWEIGD